MTNLDTRNWNELSQEEQEQRYDWMDDSATPHFKQYRTYRIYEGLENDKREFIVSMYDTRENAENELMWFRTTYPSRYFFITG